MAYANGRGVPQDYVEAHKWLNLAASRADAENETYEVKKIDFDYFVEEGA